MCRELLPLLGEYDKVRPGRAKSAPDGRRDLIAEFQGMAVFGAVAFRDRTTDSARARKAIIQQFRADLDRACAERSDLRGFVFFTNVELPPGSVNAFRALAQERGITHVGIFCRKQLQQALDSTQGAPIRRRYLGIEMTREERAVLRSRQVKVQEERRLREERLLRTVARRLTAGAPRGPKYASEMIRRLDDMRRRMARVARKFDDAARRVIRPAAAGDAFYRLEVLSRRECAIYPVGNSPATDVVVRVVDLDQDPADPFGRVTRIRGLKPLHGAVMDLGVDWMQQSPRSVNVFFTAPHGAFTQQIRGCRLPSGDWAWASRTETVSGSLLDLDVPEGFPVKEVGIEDWLRP